MNGQFIFKNKFCKDYQNKDEFDNYLFTSLDIKEIFILSSIKIISLNIIQNLLDFINTPHPNAPRINALFPGSSLLSITLFTAARFIIFLILWSII